MSLLFLRIAFPNKKKGTRKWWHLISFQGGTRTHNLASMSSKRKNILYNCCSSHWLTDQKVAVIDVAFCNFLLVLFFLAAPLQAFQIAVFWGMIIPTMLRDFDHMQKGPKGPKCSRELRSNWEGALPRPFHDLLCHLAKGLNFNFALSRQISVSEVPTTLDAWGAPFVKWL